MLQVEGVHCQCLSQHLTVTHPGGVREKQLVVWISYEGKQGNIDVHVN